MENLALHIEYLLLQHDCVVLPGLGAFINVYEAPEFDFKAGVITPIRREVRFNPALRTDDGILANSYARKNAVSYREGSELMARAIATLTDTLRLDGEATIGRLGIISRGAEGNLVFSPFRSSERMAADTGRYSVSFRSRAVIENEDSSLAEPTGPTALRKDHAADSDAAAREATISEPSCDSRIRKMNFERNYYIPVNKIAAKACACLLVVFFLAVLCLIPSAEQPKSEERASVVPIEKIIDTAVRETKNISSTFSAKSKESPEDPAGDNKTLTSLPYSEVDSDTYYLIVATCTTCEEAMRFANRHNGQGYALQVVESTKMCRVSAESSTDKDKLIETMRSEEFKSKFPQAWIWRK